VILTGALVVFKNLRIVVVLEMTSSGRLPVDVERSCSPTARTLSILDIYISRIDIQTIPSLDAQFNVLVVGL